MSIDKVPATSFYQDDGDKIKQNWFLYEYANILFSKIEEHPELASYRKKHNADKIRAFCVYYSKRLRQIIANAQMRQPPVFAIDARYIYEFYPNNSRAQTQTLLEAAFEAWQEHLQACRNCPNQCLTDGFDRTDAFDNLKHSGWPTR